MKIISSTTVLAALVASSFSLAQAAPKSKDNPGAQGRETLQQVDELSASMVFTADRLAMRAKETEQGDIQLNGLNDLKEEVNGIGRDLRALEAKEGTLPDWERSALDEVLPLMNEIAAKTEAVLQSFHQNRSHMWATAFPAESAKIYEDAAKVKEIVDGHLKLAGLHEREQRVGAALGE